MIGESDESENDIFDSDNRHIIGLISLQPGRKICLKLRYHQKGRIPCRRIVSVPAQLLVFQ